MLPGNSNKMDFDAGTGEKTDFATADNLENCIQYLNHSLEAQGFSPIPDLEGNEERANMASVLNCIHSLVQYNHRQSLYREKFLENHQRLLSEMKHLEIKLERSGELVSSKEREIQSITGKSLKNESELRSQLSKLQSDREESHRIATAAQQVRTQLSHELKKREKEFSRLQDKLSSLLADKKERTKSSIEVLNPTQYQREGRSRGTWGGKKVEGDFYKMLIDGYEARKNELLSESSQLKATLRMVLVQFQRLCEDFGLANSSVPGGSAGKAFVEGSDARASSATEDIPGSQGDGFGLHFGEGRETVEAQLVEAMAALREHLSVQEARRGGTKQEAPPSQGDSGGRRRQHDSKLAQDEERTKEWLQQQLAAVESERQSVRDMAARLDREQMQIEEARAALAEEQLSFTTALKLWAPSLAERNSLSQVLSPTLLQRLKDTPLKQ